MNQGTKSCHRRVRMFTRRRLMIGLFVLLGMGLLAQGSGMRIKAVLAQWLIARSWAETVAHHAQPAKPWPWADITPIARLSAPRLGVEQYIMNDDSGEALAFGAGFMPESAAPGGAGHSVLAGHRDSHFAFLAELKIGDVLSVENRFGEQREYTVRYLQVVDTRVQAQVNIQPQEDRLTLITCYPFDALVPGGPLRYVVEAD